MTVLEEGPKARSIDLFYFDEPDVDYPSGHLFNALALSSADTQDGSSKLYVPASAACLILPGTP